jgi:hypothetical protein
MRSYLLPLALIASGLPAAAAASNYSATLAATPKGNVIARDILWSCTAGACTGASDYSRPLIVCQSLAKKAGRVEAFRVNGQALAAADLERCNASAKPAPATASGNN